MSPSRSVSVTERMQSVPIDRSRRAYIGEYVEVCLDRRVDAVVSLDQALEKPRGRIHLRAKTP